MFRNMMQRNIFWNKMFQSIFNVKQLEQTQRNKSFYPSVSMSSLSNYDYIRWTFPLLFGNLFILAILKPTKHINFETFLWNIGAEKRANLYKRVYLVMFHCVSINMWLTHCYHPHASKHLETKYFHPFLMWNTMKQISYQSVSMSSFSNYDYIILWYKMDFP